MPFTTNSDEDNFERENRERESAYTQMLEYRRQSAFDKTLESHGGQPVENVKPELARQWQVAVGGDELAEPRLSAYAQEISTGRRIKIKTHEL